MPDDLQQAATRAAVIDIYDAYGKLDFARVAARIAPDIRWIIHGPAQVFPFTGMREGKVAVLETMGEIAKLYALERYEPRWILVDGNRAAVMSDVAFTQRKTGRRLAFAIANFLSLENGLVTEFVEFADTFDLTEQALGQFIEVGADTAAITKTG